MVSGEFKGVMQSLEKAFAEQDRYEQLLIKAREKEKNANIARSVIRLMNDYSSGYDAYRILFSFIFGMKEDEIKTLYIGQGISGRDGRNPSEMYDDIVGMLQEEGWLIRNDEGELEVDYEFLELLDAVDKGEL